jgi:DNA-binding CsgD family transcriptional regulator
MGISLHTCRGPIKAVYAKLQASTQIEAVNRARQLRLLDPGQALQPVSAF